MSTREGYVPDLEGSAAAYRCLFVGPVVTPATETSASTSVLRVGPEVTESQEAPIACLWVGHLRAESSSAFTCGHGLPASWRMIMMSDICSR